MEWMISVLKDLAQLAFWLVIAVCMAAAAMAIIRGVIEALKGVKKHD